MRRFVSSEPAPNTPRQQSDWHVLRSLFPYLWAYRWRVGFALLCLVAAKWANLGVPIVLKHIVDGLDASANGAVRLAAAPLGLIAAYGLLRLSTTAFTELREVVFARVTQRAVRTIALRVFRHLHSLSMRFHLERQTGGVTRDIERGTRGVSSLVSYTLYSILPTLIEIVLVIGYLILNYEPSFALIAGVALTTYIVFTVAMTEWRTVFRRQMNDLDSKANVKAIDSLLNFETVKYFGNEDFEASRYDQSLERWEQAALQSQTSLALLNLGQSAIIAVAVTLMVWRATEGVVAGHMSLGDLVLVNAFMIQLYIPLNFLGVLYREIKQSLADMERMFSLLNANREVEDAADAKPLQLNGAEVVFDRVQFGYDPRRQVLHDVSFTIPAGTTCAVVGPSGSGKSTLARLLYRFYDVGQGEIRIDGQPLASVTQASLRAGIGIVPQDTVLFNDSIEYNIAYGKPGASREEVERAARAAHIHDMVLRLPDGYATVVGERGLKLSGGEKQRVAIARTLLKNPAILIFDEATSALDTRNEQAIQAELQAISRQRTTLIIAHRLSTVVDADRILVMDSGRVVEQGTHLELLNLGGRYAAMWAAQAKAPEEAGTE